MLDISLIIRQGLQYALARGAVIGLIPVLASLFIADLALNRQERLADIFRERGWIYASLAALSFIAYWRRREQFPGLRFHGSRHTIS